MTILSILIIESRNQLIRRHYQEIISHQRQGVDRWSMLMSISRVSSVVQHGSCEVGNLSTHSLGTVSEMNKRQELTVIFKDHHYK